MRLSLIYEAGMDRRGFLKLLGKGAVVAAGAPLDKLGGLDKLGKFVGSLADNAYYSVWFGNDLSRKRGNFNADAVLGMALKCFNALKQSGVTDISGNSRSWHLNGVLNPLIAKRMIASGEKQEYGGGNVYRVDLGMGNDMDLILSHKPEDYSEIQKEFPISNVDDLVKSVVANLNKWASSGWKVNVSDKLRSELASKGLSINDTTRTPFDKLPDAIQKQIKRERIRRDKSSGREVGYEKEGQFDPQSSRPAQALGPFESRLSDAFRSIL